MTKFPIERRDVIAIIITYNPDERLLQSIKVLQTLVNQIVIIDNNSHLEIGAKLEELDCNNLIIIFNKENFGIAKALNIGADYALDHNYLWMLMLDQDTIPYENLLEIYNSVFLSYIGKKKIGQIGVLFEGEKVSSKVKYLSVNTLITSGSILSLEAFKLCGRFDENLYIDSVDFEYSLRLKRNGFLNLSSTKVAISHRLGDTRCKKLCFIVFRSTNHNALRRYYMARNHIIITKKYFFSFPIWVLKKNFYFIKSIIQVIIVDENKMMKVRFILRGIVHGIFYQFKN